jgi:FlaG/FlaF family flagellin (archaellin)
MLTRRSLLVATAWTAAVGVSALAADTSAQAFVEAIYATYKGKDGNGVTLDSEKTIRRYFEPSLAALMVKDQKDAAKRNDTPTLDGDPFIDAQDWDIEAVNITITDIDPGKAQATVNFKNRETPTTIVLDLVKIKSDWRIADITWQHDGKPETLRGLYKR